MGQTYIFKSNFLFSSGTWPVTGCRNVFRFSLWLWRQKGKEVVVKMKKVETQPKGGQALNSDRDSDHVGARPSVLQWDY